MFYIDSQGARHEEDVEIGFKLMAGFSKLANLNVGMLRSRSLGLSAEGGQASSGEKLFMVDDKRNDSRPDPKPARRSP